MCILNGERKKVEGMFMQKISVNFDCVEKTPFSYSIKGVPEVSQFNQRKNVEGIFMQFRCVF